MYMSARNSDVISVSAIFRLFLSIIPTVWYFCFSFLLAKKKIFVSVLTFSNEGYFSSLVLVLVKCLLLCSCLCLFYEMKA